MDREALAAWFESHLDWDRQRITSIVELDGGWESDIYRIGLSHDDGVEDLVIRRYVGADGPIKARREHDGMLHLHRAGYPVPLVHAVEVDPTLLGRPFLVMEWVPGRVDRGWPEVLQPDQLGGFVQLLVDLHGLDWRPFAEPADRDDLAAGRATERQIDEARTLEGMPSGFRAVLDWLADHVPASKVEAAVVHWDFHVGNILVADDGRTTVVDWTQITATDPRFDVAWTRLLIAMAVGRSAADVFLAEYERRAAALPDLSFYDVAAAFKRLYSVAASLVSGPETLGMRPEAAERMRAGLPTLAVPYRTVREHTGLRIAEVEALLAASPD